MRSVRGILTIAAVASSLGCSSGSEYSATTASVQRHPSTVAAATGSTGTVGTTGSGTTTGGATSSGGSTSGVASTSGGIQDAGCATDEAQFTSYAYDLQQAITLMSLPESPAVGVMVTTTPSYGSATTDANGLFNICVPKGQTFTTSFADGTTYVPMVMEAQNLEKNQLYLTSTGGVPMITPTLLGLIESHLPSNYDPSLSGAMIAITSLSDEITCDRAGWLFTAQSVDGGAPSTPWPIAYVDYSGNVTEGPTTEAGLALLYNVDSSVPAITVTLQDLDAGVGCAPIPNTGLSNSVPLFPPSEMVLSFYAILVP